MDTVTCAKGIEGKSMSEGADLLLMSRTIDFLTKYQIGRLANKVNV